LTSRDRSRSGPAGGLNGPATALGSTIVARLKRTWLDPFHIVHATLEQGLARHRAQIRGRVLDIGCGKKPYRRLFPSATYYVGTETNRTFTPGSRADVTALGEALPFAAGAFDAVVCTEVLEHVPEPGDFLREVFRVITPGGVLLLTTPQTWGLHEEPYDFYRYTKYGLAYLFRKVGFEVLEISPTTGTLGTVGQRLSSFFYYGLGGRTRVLKPLAVVICAGIQLIFATADRLAGRHGDTINWIALGRRPA
jgi:SAM-dependent methyltransferase